MSEIIPALIPEDFGDLQDKLGMVAGQVPLVHIDVMDGSFTKKMCWPYAGDDIGTFLRITEEAEGFPFWEDLSFEVHLMMKGVEEASEDWIKAGAERIIVHYEVFVDDAEVTQFLSKLKNKFSEASSYLGVEVGLAVKLDTDIQKILPHVVEADFIQLMSIGEIGAQGHAFQSEVFSRIEVIKKAYPDTIISVDGGITQEIAEELLEAGVNRMVVGGAIFNAEDPTDALNEFLGSNR